MLELTMDADVHGLPLPSIAETAQLRRRYGYRSYRKNVCFITLNGSYNGASFMNILNGFGGF